MSQIYEGPNVSPIGNNVNGLGNNVSYWPGHVVAECLIDESENIESIRKNSQKQSKENNNENNKAGKAWSKLAPSNAFSAIISSMTPFELLAKIRSPKGDEANEEFTYDEFGFKIEKEERSSSSSNDPNVFVNIRLSPCPNPARRVVCVEPFVEDSKHKLKWMAYLEFTLNADIGASFSWDQVTVLNKCEKLKAMIRGQGVPHSLRPFVWMRLSGAMQKKLNSKFKYCEFVKDAENDQFHSSKQIEKDLLRTLPTNYCFSTLNSVGVPRLRRVLQCLAWLYPNIGYCQGMGTIAATLLLFLEEEDSFWMMCTIIEDILPASYYSHTLLGVQADMKVLRQLVATYLPEVEQQLKKHDVELSLVCINWFLTIFSNSVHIRVLLRVWDLFFYDGSAAMFQLTLAMLKLNEAALKAAESSSQIFTILSELPSEVSDVDVLFEASIRVGSSVNKSLVDSTRRKHQAYLMAQNGSFVNPSNYNNLPMAKEKPQFRNNFENRGKNLLKILKKGRSQSSYDINNNNNHDSSIQSFNESSFADDSSKMKNIIQTEFLVNLREIILKIAHHFQKYDAEKYASCNLATDYSIDSHSRDLENYMDTSKMREFKRAKALLDFEKSDDDELGFRKNDIITVLSTKDDHCWIGELNGEKGWFPSRFAALIDERNGKVYSSAGDDAVNERIGDLIRGEFTLAIKSIFEHGLKKWKVLGGFTHPWSFIEEAARKTIEKDFDSVYSRIVLCKTFRLDEDGKVLTPDELLFRSIQLINLSHDVYKTELDAKLRALICVGLNEQVLHIWLETLCSTLEVVEKWYHQWSFIRSPGWVQIKCELRILSQFSFLLNPDDELPDNKKESAINECIKDMLIKHHLFSWDIN